MSTPQTVVLISGANRGIGRGLLATYLTKRNHVVIAANRDPTHPTSTSLVELPKGENTKLIIVKVDSSVESDASQAVERLVSTEGIAHIDTVIANAGIAAVFPTVAEVKLEDLQSHITVNVFGTVSLYQATLPLLKKSKTARWIAIGSSAGWLENQLPVPNAAYGPSKAALHWLTKRINAEEGDITAFVIHPGWAQTETGNYSAKVFGLDEAPVTIEESVSGVVSVIEASTKKSHGGKMWGHEGEFMAW